VDDATALGQAALNGASCLDSRVARNQQGVVTPGSVSGFGEHNDEHCRRQRS
jgi:hypothetical protein